VMTRHAPESVVVGEYKDLHHQMRITVLVLNTSRIKLGFDLTSGVGRERLEHWIHRHGHVLIKFQIRQSILNPFARDDRRWDAFPHSGLPSEWPIAVREPA